MSLQRGDLVTVTVAGDYGKPRPAVVVQSDLFADLPSVIVALVTGTITGNPLLRVLIAPGTESGLEKPSDVMVDKLLTLPREKVGRRIGRLDGEAMRSVDLRLAAILGLVGRGA